MGGPVDIPGDQLRTIVERIEHIEKEISELNEGKREIYQEAKSNGFDPKALREIVRLAKTGPEGARGARVPARGLSKSDQWKRLQGRLTLRKRAFEAIFNGRAPASSCVGGAAGNASGVLQVVASACRLL